VVAVADLMAVTHMEQAQMVGRAAEAEMETVHNLPNLVVLALLVKERMAEMLP
jgi:hypothetical protein